MLIQAAAKEVPMGAPIICSGQIPLSMVPKGLHLEPAYFTKVCFINII
jgi:hypothetical protein